MWTSETPDGAPGRLSLCLASLLVAAGCESSPPQTASSPATRTATSSAPAATSPAGPGELVRPPPRSAAERLTERLAMVRTQLEQPIDDRPPVRDARVLEAIRAVPRHVFVPERLRRLAYADAPLPIGNEQTISQPYIVALMTEALDIRPGERVLEIGTGSGYQAAILAHLTPEVYTIEIVEPLAERARRVLADEGYAEIHCRTGDGYAGWPEAAPFDAVILTCATGEVPRPLWEQLRPGGRLIMPLGEPGGAQELVLLTKQADGGEHRRRITLVRFVPLTREKMP